MLQKGIIIYGAGDRGVALFKLARCCFKEIIVVDGSTKKQGQKVDEVTVVQHPDIIKEKCEYLVVNTILNSRNYNIVEKIIRCDYGVREDFIINYEKICFECLEHLSVRDEKTMPSRSLFSEEWKIIFDAYCCESLGGIESWLEDISIEMYMRKMDVRLLCDQNGKMLFSNNKEFIDCVERESSILGNETLSNFLAIKEYLLQKLPCTIIVNRADVVLCAAASIKKDYPEHIRIVSVVHNGTNSSYFRQKEFSHCVDMYVGVSKDIETSLIELGVDSRCVSSMTIPFSCPQNLKRAYNVEPVNRLRIGYAGRLDGMKNKQKRMDLLLEVIRKLVKDEVEFLFEFAGDGPARLEMETIVKSEDLEGYVSFLGRISRNEIGKFWQKQDIGINMSDYEGRSISQMESMANGAVPIVTKVSGTCEDIVDGVNGYTVPLGNVDAAVEKIEYLFNNRNLLPLLGESAHEMMKAKCDRNKHYEYWEKLIKVNRMKK